MDLGTHQTGSVGLNPSSCCFPKHSSAPQPASQSRALLLSLRAKGCSGWWQSGTCVGPAVPLGLPSPGRRRMVGGGSRAEPGLNRGTTPAALAPANCGVGSVTHPGLRLPGAVPRAQPKTQHLLCPLPGHEALRTGQGMATSWHGEPVPRKGPQLLGEPPLICAGCHRALTPHGSCHGAAAR